MKPIGHIANDDLTRAAVAVLIDGAVDLFRRNVKSISPINVGHVDVNNVYGCAFASCGWHTQS